MFFGSSDQAPPGRNWLAHRTRTGMISAWRAVATAHFSDEIVDHSGDLSVGETVAEGGERQPQGAQNSEAFDGS